MEMQEELNTTFKEGFECALNGVKRVLADNKDKLDENGRKHSCKVTMLLRAEIVKWEKENHPK